jgi:hypothetical protein
MFELLVFKTIDAEPEDPNYSVQIIVPTELAGNIESWVEAASCFLSYIARHSTSGYEKMLEIVNERAMAYRESGPRPHRKKDDDDISSDPDGPINPPPEPDSPPELSD